ncbi:MAG: purine-nucleoside phosphorylase [Clostridiales bacterium]|nr:purine-nucleoside phosphorylase [Clostridiales bacterium]
MEKVKEAASYLSSKVGAIPKIAIVLGSGLAPLAHMCDKDIEIPYKDIPGFPESTAPGHDGKMIFGKLSGKDVVMMSGRFHYYEGYDLSLCTFYVRVLAYLKVETLYLTNAAGGLGDEMEPSDLMVITDHISLFCESALRGANLPEFGVRFPDQSSVYDKEYIELLSQCADDLEIRLHKGVYAYTRGPQYETPADIRALKILGADAVGMSTVPEAVAASHSGLRIVAVSCISNMAAGISKNPLTHEEVLENAGKASFSSCALVKEFIARC